MELQQHILTMQAVVHDLADENRKLRYKVEEFERITDFGKDFESKEGVYWRDNYPYCPNCWEADRKPTRLAGPYRIANSPSTHPIKKWNCPIHNITYCLPK